MDVAPGVDLMRASKLPATPCRCPQNWLPKLPTSSTLPGPCESRQLLTNTDHHRAQMP